MCYNALQPAHRREFCEEFRITVKVTTERLPKSQIALDIELDDQQVQRGLDRAARKLSEQFRIPGFRPGKAPRKIVENYFGRERLLEEATEDLIQKSFPQALKQENILPVGRPTLERVEQQPFRYRVIVPVEPTVELGDYRAFRQPLEPEPVSEESVQKLLEAQREQHVVLRELEEPRPAQPGDMVSVVIESVREEDEEEPSTEAAAEAAPTDNADTADELAADAEDDADEAETDAREQQIALVEGRVRPEIYQALLGAQPGDVRTVTLAAEAEDEAAAEAADADAEQSPRTTTYTLRVTNVQERLLPEWDELPTLVEFDGDLDALRAHARQRLERAAEEKARRALVDAFINHLVAQHPVELPDAMIRERAEELFHQQVAEFARYGISEEQYLSMLGKSHDEAVAQYMEQAEPEVRRSLLLREFVRREGLTVTEADLAAERERFLEEIEPQRRDEARALLNQPNMTQMLAQAALDRKLRERIVAIATGQLAAQAQEEQAVTQATPSVPPAGDDAQQPRVLDDVATGGVTHNNVFADVGSDPASQPGRSAVEQAVTGDDAQQPDSPETAR